MILLRDSLVASRTSLLSLAWVQRGVLPKGSCIVLHGVHSALSFFILPCAAPGHMAWCGNLKLSWFPRPHAWQGLFRVYFRGPVGTASDWLPPVIQLWPQWRGHAILIWMKEWVLAWQVYELSGNSKAAYFLLFSNVIKSSSFSMPWYPRLSVGFELLRKMGWKEGQGIGPRVKRRPRRQKPGMYNDCR